MNFNKLILDKSDERLDELRIGADYIQDYIKELTEDDKRWLDNDAIEFYSDFIPLWGKYVGTKQLLKCIKDYVKTHKVIRKDDLRFQLITMWINHIQLCCEYHNVEFKAEYCFKIKIPKAILDII